LVPRYGKLMKQIAAAVDTFTPNEISTIENSGKIELTVENQPVEILITDVEIITEDIPGWVVSNMGNLTVALDITITETLRQEGIARELINRIQNLRKDKGFEVTDKIKLQIEKNSEINTPIENNFAYICSETLADSLDLVQVLDNEEKIEIEIIEGLKTFITIQKMV